MVRLMALLFVLLTPTTPILTLTSPVTFQVFQRDGSTGDLYISGQVANANVYSVSASWHGVNSGVLWQGTSAHFSVVWHGLPIGQDDLIVTAAGISVVVPLISIGDVYVITGQSNAVGHGTNLQMYMDDLGLRASMFGYDYQWQELQDPTGESRTAQDRVFINYYYKGGSIWPLLASYILNAGIPVAFIPAARGGSSVRSWQPGLDSNTLEQALERRLFASGMVRAILWQQGETDAHAGMRARDYATYFEAYVDRINGKFHIPIFAATLAPSVYSHGWQAINDGIALAIVERPGVVLRGADLTSLTPDGGVHFNSDEMLQIEALLWWRALVDAGYYTDAPLSP